MRLWTNQAQTASVQRAKALQNDPYQQVNFERRFQCADFNGNEVLNCDAWLEFLEGYSDEYERGLT